MAEENVIQVVLRAVDQMSADLRKVEGEISRLTGATQRAEQTTTRLTGSNRSLISTLGPMRGALGQVTTMLAQMNPQAAILISSMDNLALSLASAGLRFGSLAAILKTAGIIGLIIGITSAIGNLVSGWQTARKAQEDFKKSLDELGVQRAGFGASSALGAISAQADERARQIAKLLAENARSQQSSILSGIPGAASLFGGTLSLEQQAALENELALLTPKLVVGIESMIDAIEKQTRARRDGITVLEEEIRVLEAQINMTQGTGDPAKSAKAAADMKELELNLLRQLGPGQQAYIDQVVRGARADREATDALQLKNEQLNFYLESLRKQQTEIFKAAPDPLAGDEMTIQEEMVQISEVMRNVETNLNRESLAMATSMADSFSRTFTDRLVMFISGDGQITIQQLAADIGKTLVTTLIQAIIKEMLISPLQKIIAQWVNGGSGQASDFSLFGAISDTGRTASLFGGSGGTGGIGGAFSAGSSLFGLLGKLPIGPGGMAIGEWASLSSTLAQMESGLAAGAGAGFSSIWSSILSLFGFAHGGMVVPPGALQKFQHGGVVRGPTMGVIGEEGPEIVARMKPMRPGDEGGDLHQNIYLVDQRPPRLGRNDVLLIIDDDMRRGGKTAKGVENVVRRGGHGR